MIKSPIDQPKVMHIITGLNVGGAERSLHNLLSYGLKKNFSNMVVSLTDHGYFSEQISTLGVPVEAAEISRKSFISGISGIKKLVTLTKDFKPDIIQGWMYHGNLAAVLAKNLSGLNSPVVWNMRHSLHSIKKEKTTTAMAIRLNKIFSTKANTVIYNSNISKDQHRQFGLKNQNSIVVPNGFDTDLFKPNVNSKNQIRTELGIDSDQIVVGNVARCHPMKNHRGLIRVAVKTCLERNNVCFVLAGKDVNYANTNLSELIPSNLRKRIMLVDERSDIPALLNCFDIYVQSSKWGEAFPNALAEAMATELYCIATDIGDSRIIMADHGHVVSSADDAAIHSTLSEALTMPSEKRQKKGSRARNRINKLYSIQSSIDMYVNTYENLLR